MSQDNLESYPPLFRPSLKTPTRKPNPKQQQQQRRLVNGAADHLPVIDMECLDVEKVDTICKEWGIFRLVNHGVPTKLFKSLQDQAKKIFDLPYEAKQGLISNCPINYFWGTPALTQSGAPLKRAAALNNLDWMEGFHVPFSHLHDHHPLVDHHPLINSFRNLLEDYSEHVTRIARTIFEAMIKGLKVDDVERARSYLDESTGLVRVYRYPRHNFSEDVKGLHTHTDSSVFSILSEDEVGGLKFLKDEQWFDVHPIPGTLVVNLGDMMQVVSDEKYKSVKHKVELNEKERLSICYFVFPEENTMIHTSNYKPFTYADFRAQVQQDLKTVGRKIALESFKLPRVISKFD